MDSSPQPTPIRSFPGGPRRQRQPVSAFVIGNSIVSRLTLNIGRRAMGAESQMMPTGFSKLAIDNSVAVSKKAAAISERLSCSRY